MSKFNWDEFSEVPASSSSNEFKWDEYEAESEGSKIAREGGTVSAALRQGMQGLMAGFYDEAVGGLGSLGHLPEVIRGEESLGDAYRSERDRMRDILGETQKQHPTTSFISNLVGGVVGPGKLLKGATAAKRVKEAAMLGGTLGLGNSDSDLTKGEVGGALVDTAVGAGLGAGLQYGGEKLIDKGSAVAKAIGSKFNLEKTANKLAAKAMGAGKADFKRPEDIQRLGKAALDNKIVTPFASTETMLSRAEALKQSGGEAMEQAFNQIDDAGLSTFNPLEVASKVDDVLAPTYRTHINKSEVNQLENTLDSILARGDGNISINEAQALKKELGSVAFPKGKRPLDPSPKQIMAEDAYHIVNQAIDDVATGASETLGSAVSKLLQKGKSDYGAGKQTAKLLQNKLAGQEAGTGIKAIVDNAIDVTAVATAPLTNGGSIAGLGIKKAIQFGMDKSNQIGAVSLNNLSKLLQTAPEHFGKYAPVLQMASKKGNKQLATTVFILGQQDENFRKLINSK